MNRTRFFSISLKMILVVFLMLVLISACKKEENPEALDRDSSYAFGMLMANMLSGQMGVVQIHFDYQAFMEGFRDYNEANETRLTQEQAIEKINAAITMLQAQEDERIWVEGEKNREDGDAYRRLHGSQEGVITTDSGLQYEVITEGTGPKPGPDDSVRVQYEGAFINGDVFESSFGNTDSVEFSLYGVIPGWQEGIQLMNVGSTYRFVIPPDLAYGPSGNGPIPPSATLVFKVELLSIIDQDTE